MKILAVEAELHIFADEVNWARPLRLRILFGDGTALRLRCSGDGEGLIVERLPLEPPMDMGEYGRTDIFDITDRLEPALKHEAIGEPRTIRSPAGRLIGLALPRPHGAPFCIWINGDEIRWGPQGALREDDWVDGGIPALAGPFPD